jgi:hypothetical protein
VQNPSVIEILVDIVFGMACDPQGFKQSPSQSEMA